MANRDDICPDCDSINTTHVDSGQTPTSPTVYRCDECGDFFETD